MKDSAWPKAIKASADPQRTKHFLDLLAATAVGPVLGKISAEQARVLAALFSGSPALSNLLIANPDWLATLDIEHIRHPRRKQGLAGEVTSWFKPLMEVRDYSGAYMRLRQFKQKQMLRIAARDLARVASAPEITREISDVADVCLETVWQICRQQFIGRFGRPYHQDANGKWHATQFCVLG